jgi:hypothetical protein
LRDDRLPTNRPLASALANRAVASGRPARYPIYEIKRGSYTPAIITYLISTYSSMP